MEKLLGLSVPVLFVLGLLVEAIRPGRRFATIRAWRITGIGFVVLSIVVSGVAQKPLLAALSAHPLFDGARLGVVGGTIVGYLAVTLAAALWHRAQHRVPLLWRTFHQLHHAPQRMDLPGVFYFHPLDVLSNTALSMAVNLAVLGLPLPVAGMVGALVTLSAIFQHTNVRTPRWMGYVIQRPESHCLHHERDVHASNYSDFAPWDMLMGTFKNPEEFTGEVGFAGEASRRVGAMLLTIDVNAPVVVAVKAPERRPSKRPSFRPGPQT